MSRCCVSCIIVFIFRTSGKIIFFNKKWQVFDCCSTISRKISCSITFFVSLYNFIHFIRFYILLFNKSFPMFAFFFFFFFTDPFFSPCNDFIMQYFFVGSLFKRVNEIILIWCCTFLQYFSLPSKTNLEPLPWTLIVRSFEQRNSCKDFSS